MCPQGFFLSYELAEPSQRCDAIPSLNDCHSFLGIVGIVRILVFIGQSIAPSDLLAEP